MRITLDIDFDTEDATPEDYQILKAVSDALAGRPANPETLAAADEKHPAVTSAHKAVQELEKKVEKAAKKTAAKQSKKVDQTPEPVDPEQAVLPDEDEEVPGDHDFVPGFTQNDILQRATGLMSAKKHPVVKFALDKLEVERVREVESEDYSEFMALLDTAEGKFDAGKDL